MSNKWSTTSKSNLDTCHSDLVVLANAVLKIHDCSVKQGHRDEATQNKYYRRGTSKVKFPNSKHNKYPAQAIDLSPYKPGHSPWDMEDVLYFAGIVVATANHLHKSGLMQHRIKWGGTWRIDADAAFSFDRNGFFDGIHFELVM